MLPWQQHRMIEEAKFTYSLLGKGLEKHIETVEEHGKKQVQALKILKSPSRELPSIQNFKKSRNPKMKN